MKNLKLLLAASTLCLAIGANASGHHHGEGKSCPNKDKNCQMKMEKCDKEKKCDMKKKKCDGKKMYKHHGYKKHDRKYRSHHKGDMTRFIIGAVYALELTKEQKGSIDKTIKEFQENRNKRFEAFSKDGFDKEAFIKSRSKSKEDHIRAKADLIEKIYSVLTSKQKAELKEEMDDFQKVRKHKRW